MPAMAKSSSPQALARPGGIHNLNQETWKNGWLNYLKDT
jgi:hypothetical protein